MLLHKLQSLVVQPANWCETCLLHLDVFVNRVPSHHAISVVLWCTTMSQALWNLSAALWCLFLTGYPFAMLYHSSLMYNQPVPVKLVCCIRMSLLTQWPVSHDVYVVSQFFNVGLQPARPCETCLLHLDVFVDRVPVSHAVSQFFDVRPASPCENCLLDLDVFCWQGTR